MDASLREVTIQIGKKSYFLKTTLDDESLRGISSLSAEITKEFAGSLDQEYLLLLSCLQLAWILEKLGRKLEKSLIELKDEEAL